jgi:rhamnogalacturonan endolyase
MKGLFFSLVATLLAGVASAAPTKQEPFLTEAGNRTWVIGNDVWNMTQGPIYGVKLWYKGRDCVDEAVGHYVSYSNHPIPSYDFKKR